MALVTTQQFLQEKGISLLFACSLLIMLDPMAFLTVGIILGQGHFIIAYIYKLRSGRLSWWGFSIWVAVTIFMLVVFSAPEMHVPLSLMMTLYLVTHGVVDDRFLGKPEKSRLVGLEMLILLALYYAMVIDMVYPTVAIRGLVIVGAGVGLIPYFLLARRSKDGLDVFNGFFLMQILVLMGVMQLGFLPVLFLFNVTAALYHYTVWYVVSARKTENNPKSRRTLIGWVGGVHVALVALFLVFTNTAWGASSLFFIFDEQYFLIWAFLHFFSSTRLSDFDYFKAIITGPPASQVAEPARV